MDRAETATRAREDASTASTTSSIARVADRGWFRLARAHRFALLVRVVPSLAISLYQLKLHNAKCGRNTYCADSEGSSPVRGVGLLTLSLLVGVGAGLGAVAFRYMIEGGTHAVHRLRRLRRPRPCRQPARPVARAVGSSLLAPVVAGLLYGPLVYRFAREARGHGVPEVMVAVARNGGRIRPQVAVVKALASALCIGGGGSVGREGPIVQIGSALGSTLGPSVHLDERRIRLLVACGAAGGIAATFNAPLAGVFFAMEIILRAVRRPRRSGWSCSPRSPPASSAAAILGNNPFLTLPTFHIDHLVQYPLFALLGLVAGRRRRRLLPRPLRHRGRLRLGLARPGVAAPRRRWAAARRAAAGAAARCTASATRCWAKPSPAGTPSRSWSRCWSASWSPAA